MICLSPILQGLTVDISDDSLWALTILMFGLNLIFHNYNDFNKNDFIEFPDSLSINCAIFASVLLASRLNSTQDAFYLISFSCVLFGLFPITRRNIRSLNGFDILINNNITVVL